jgi:hypothetical protein
MGNCVPCHRIFLREIEQKIIAISGKSGVNSWSGFQDRDFFFSTVSIALEIPMRKATLAWIPALLLFAGTALSQINTINYLPQRLH